MIDVGGVLVVADVTFSVALIFYGTKLSGNFLSLFYPGGLC